MKRIYIIFFLLTVSCFLRGQENSPELNSIQFTGNNNFSDGTLLNIMSSNESGWFSTGYYNPETIKDDLDEIKTFYIQHGFADVAITGQDIIFNNDSTEVNIIISISEGTPTAITAINITGNSYFTEQMLLENLNMAVDDRYEENKIFRGINDIKKMYLNAGFLDCRVNDDSVYDSGLHTAAVTFRISEGTRYKVNNIFIEGLTTVRSFIVEREIEFHENEFLSLESIAASQKNLYRTSLFSSVIINPVPSEDSTKKNILIKLKEDDPGVLDLSAGFGTIEKYRFSSGVTYRNLIGLGYRASLNGKLSSIDRSIQPSITDPWVFGIPWGMDVFGTMGQKKEPSFRYNYWETGLNLFKDFSDRSKFIMSGVYDGGYFHDFRFKLFEGAYDDSVITPEFEEALNAIFRDMKITIHRVSLKLSLIYDQRDNLFNPSKGYYLNLSSEYIYGTAEISLLDISFKSRNKILRSQADLKYFYMPGSSTIIASSMTFGLINNLIPDEEIFMVDNLFYAGGPNSLRGFGYQLAGPLSETGAPRGGQLKFVWNVLEVRQHLVWIIGAVAFLDAGNIWSTAGDFKLNSLRYSPGLGIRINTPIGLARLDYGFNPWPKAGESRSRLWFGIGNSF